MMRIDIRHQAGGFAGALRIYSGRTMKVTLLLSVIFILKTITSCIDPAEWDFELSFNKITITNLDNSGIYPTETNSDIMYAPAVAFTVTLSDETILASGVNRRSNNSFTGFTPAYAMSPEPRYYPLNRITGISIVTLEAMSPEIPAGTDVTGLFAACVPRFNAPGFLYIDSSELLSAIDRDFYPDEPSVTFQLFCREEIAGDKAQFEINITLSDESTLSATTNLITLVRNE
jgi:hypothetical protein